MVYSIICHHCGCLFIGETGRRLRECFSEHLGSVRNNSPGFPVAEHFNLASHSLNDIMICSLECCGDNARRKKQEMSSGPSSQMASTLTLALFKCVHCFYLVRTHVTHTLSHIPISELCFLRAHVTSKRTFTVSFFVWHMPTCHNRLFDTDEGLCLKPLCIF